jgi:hypothetical protein
MLKRIINILIIVFIVIIISWFTEINYQDLSFDQNRSPYLGIISMVLMIISMVLVKRQQKNKSSN